MKSERGATLVEVLVAIALAGVMLPVLATALITSNAGRATSQQQLKATALLHEATEAVRVVRESGWGNIATNGTYHPVISSSSWALASGNETIDGLTRQITISNGSDALTKHIEVSVAWSTPYSGSVTGDLYLTRWQNNTTWVQTTNTDFAAGTTTSTAVVNVSGGEVELAGAPTYQTSGTFESTTFDASATVVFNYLWLTVNQPASTTIQFQIATNTDGVTWNYVGPDGTNSTFFTNNAAIPTSAANARYFRYKAFLTGDGTVTPTLSDITVGYSP